VAAVTSLLYSHGANINALDQHTTDPEGGDFFMRLEFQTPHLDLTKPALEKAFAEGVGERFAMSWRFEYAADVKRMAILCSRTDHCVLELLWRWARGELPCHVPMVISNHPDLTEAVERFGVPFHYVPVTQENKAEAEQTILSHLEGKADLVVLARYMQILSEDFVAPYTGRIINIHHSFLPAFVGADPYRQAYDRGVKLIGATAHYVIAELDAGPIIEQGVVRVSHRDTIEGMKRLGRDLERNVLARAVASHLEDRIILDGNKTVVF
jgi:formyltetrahydrofolate deformylase